MKELSKKEQCSSCGRFANRGVSIDAAIIKDDKIVLIKRGVEPSKGKWGTPGGYVDWDETVEEAVAREVKEETKLDVTSTKLVGVYSSPERHPKQVINILYLAEVAEADPAPGDDVDDVKWFLLDSLPDEMAIDHKENIKRAMSFKKSA